MKSNRGLFNFLILLSFLLCRGAAVAQPSAYTQNAFAGGITLTNDFQAPNNNFESQYFGPTTPGTGRFGLPYLGTSSLASPAIVSGLSIPTGAPLASSGPLRIYPRLEYQVTYGNGLQASPGTSSTTLINTVSPGVLLTLGDHWALNYTEGLGYYSNPVFHNTTGEIVNLQGGTVYRDWTLHLTQGYIDTTEPLFETGTQVEQTAYITALDATWQMNDHMALQMELNQNFRFAEQLNDLHEWSTADWLNYQFGAHFGAALGLTLGYDAVSSVSDMPFEEGLVRVSYQFGTNFNIFVMGGVEDRQFMGPSAPSLITSLFQVYASYNLRAGTIITLSAQRTVVPSLEVNDVNTITSVTATLRQRIWQRLFVQVSAGYTSEPFATVEEVENPTSFGFHPVTELVTTRSDTRTYEQLGVSGYIRTRMTATIFYRHLDNASTQSAFGYSGDTVGFDVAYKF